MKRRNFLALTPAAALLTPTLAKTPLSVGKFPISCNTYTWSTFYKREKKTWGNDVLDDYGQFALTGIPAIEPNVDSPEKANEILLALKKHNLQMPSIYVNSLLHVEEEAKKTLENVEKIAQIVKSVGTKIFVTNPTPIKWGDPAQKTDEQLQIQAKNLNSLGSILKKHGILLAYHTHDMEMKAGAREFHHMMQNTDPKNVHFCLDLHWIYRGCDNSQLPIFDVIKMYGSRIVELHIRQSQKGVWAESFTAEGDIDYIKVIQQLERSKIRPHLVIEQCLEDKSPRTMDMISAHKEDYSQIKKVFKSIY
ncbi:MAG: sugar phosphate isomerase/epimerase family protein [Leadbetterella sp.]